MKKVLIVAATAGLMMLAACTPAATNNTATDNGDEANMAVYNEVEPLPVDNSTNAVDAGNMADMNSSGNAM